MFEFLGVSENWVLQIDHAQIRESIRERGSQREKEKSGNERAVSDLTCLGKFAAQKKRG